MNKILKNIYNLLPFKKHLFSFLKIFPISQSIYQHLHFKGLIKINIDNKHSFKIIHHGFKIENELFWSGLYGNWEKFSMMVWTRLARESKVIFDIGANTGVYTLVAKSLNPAADVHSFEPFPAIFNRLQKNLAVNNFTTSPNCVAVSNYTGDGVIYSENTDMAYSVTVNKNLWVKDAKPIEIKIKTVALQDYITENSITQIDLMKIDVETHEPEVMEGFSKFLKEFKPLILIEILTDVVAEKLHEYFQPSEFTFYSIDEMTGIKKIPSLEKSPDFNILIVPNEKLDKIPSDIENW